ncbi:Transcription factor [Rhizina undulata]
MASTNGNHDIQGTYPSTPTSPTTTTSPSSSTSTHPQLPPALLPDASPLPDTSPQSTGTSINQLHSPPSNFNRSSPEYNVGGDEDTSIGAPPQSPILATGSSPFAPAATSGKSQLLLTSPLTTLYPEDTTTPISPTYNRNKRPSESEPSGFTEVLRNSASDSGSNSANSAPSAPAATSATTSSEKPVASQPSKRQRRNTKSLKEEVPEEGAGSKEGRKASTGSMASERPRLSEQEKKNNHIASEQKRRLAIREGFDRLTEIVPGLEGQGRSESIVLKKSVDHMRDALHERQALIQRIQALGGQIPPELRQT